MLLDTAARRSDFRALHQEGCFLLPTAWDTGSARRLERMGFAGLASSNTCLAWSLGRDDGDVTRDEVLAHLRLLMDATELPVSADFGLGFAADAKDLATNVRLAIDTGIAALSIGDRKGAGLTDLQDAVARICASHDAIALCGADVMLVGRSEGLLTGVTSVDETIERLVAYSKAGADVLCAPGLSDPAAVKAAVDSVAPKPVDVQPMRPGMTAAQLGELGVRRISTGNQLAEAAWASFERVAQEFIDFGDLHPETEGRFPLDPARTSSGND